MCVDKDFFVKNHLGLFIVIAGLLYLFSLPGRKVLALNGAIQKGLASRLINLLLRRPLDTLSLVGGSSPNANLLPLSLAGVELQVLSWNGQGICLFLAPDRLKMGPIIAKYMHNRHVVSFQEVHGSRDDI